MTTARQGFGIDALDRLLGGGLLPGTLTVVAGATARARRNSACDGPMRDEPRRGIAG